MKEIFNVITDQVRTPIIQKRTKMKVAGFRTKWGMYGTREWIENLINDNLIQEIDGRISELLMTGHDDFPEFKISNGSETYQFERLGDIKTYEVGKRIKVKAVKTKYVQPTSGFEESLQPLIIEIEK